MNPFEPVNIAGIAFRNRIIRSATYEGACDTSGFVTQHYIDLYEKLARSGAGGLITGFAYISREGRAMHQAQAGIDDPDKIPGLSAMTTMVHQHNCPVILQIAHCGRQTLSRVTGMRVRGASGKRSVYFGEKPVKLQTREVYNIIEKFALSAAYAREAGFDGIQLHAAHGYLIHQFLLPWINNRRDEFGIDATTGIGSRFLETVTAAVRNKCGPDFPLFVKISHAIHDEMRFTSDRYAALISVLDRIGVDGIEVSHGTMDYPFNIFRGDLPVDLILSKNPIFKAKTRTGKILRRIAVNLWFRPNIKPFSPAYNLGQARIAKQLTGIPVVVVGGFRSLEDIEEALNSSGADLVSMCRPFIAEPGIVLKMKEDRNYHSRCQNCNFCAVMCDSGGVTKCYKH